MTKVKLCGLQTVQDITVANTLLPDYVGFVFASSKRQVSRVQAQEMKRHLDARIQSVGVFVNPEIEEVAMLVQDGIIDVVQLHGAETERDYSVLKEKVDIPVICVVPVGRVMTKPRFDSVYQLYDTLSVARGGTGVAFDRNLLCGTNMKTAFLAGGLTPETVVQAIREVKPFAVDVSSGIETDGRKDAQKMKRFVQAVRQYEEGMRNNEA